MPSADVPDAAPAYVANTKTQRHEDIAKPPIHARYPQITQINADSLPRDSTEWRGPDRRRTTPGNRCIGSSLRTRVFVAMARYSGLRSRRAQASPPLIPTGVLTVSSSEQERGEAEPTCPGRVGRWEARRRRTLASGVDVLLTGRRSSDRRLFRRQSSALAHHVSEALFASFASLRFKTQIRGWCRLAH